jgi:hypothetical protein
MWDALSDERTDLSFAILLVLLSTFSGSNSAGLMAIFYRLRFETPPIWRARFSYEYLYPPGRRRLSFIPRNWVPFS